MNRRVIIINVVFGSIVRMWLRKCSDDPNTLECMHIPDSNRLIPRASNDFVPGAVSQLGKSVRED